MRKLWCRVFGCKFKRWTGHAGVWHLERFRKCLRCGASNPDFVVVRDEGDDYPRSRNPRDGD